MVGILLRIAAMTSMLADHIAAVHGGMPLGMTIGKLAFPIYAFLIADSFRHLSGERLNKFMRVIGIMALVSEPAFDRVFFGTFFYPGLQNQLLQFFTYGLALICAEKAGKRWQKILIWAAVIIINQLLCLGYGGGGIVLMLLYNWYLEHYRGRDWKWRLAAVFGITIIAIPVISISVFLLYGTPSELISMGTVGLSNRIVSNAPILLTVPLLALYDGTYGNSPIWFRKLYRYFYPAHLWILTAFVV